MLSTTLTLLVSIFMVQTAYTAPTFIPVPCSFRQDLTLTWTQQQDAPAFVGGTSVGSGDTVTFSQTHSVGVTITEGASFQLKLADIFTLGESTTISYVNSNAVAEGASDPCPAGGLWTCALAITPSMWEVQGWVTNSFPGTFCPKSTSGPYNVLFPITDQSGNAVVNVVACACPDYPSSTDYGAPAVCPGNCKTA